MSVLVSAQGLSEPLFTQRWQRHTLSLGCLTKPLSQLDIQIQRQRGRDRL